MDVRGAADDPGHGVGEGAHAGARHRRGWWLAYLAVALLFVGAVAATTAMRSDDETSAGAGNGREVASRGPVRRTAASTSTTTTTTAPVVPVTTTAPATTAPPAPPTTAPPAASAPSPMAARPAAAASPKKGVSLWDVDGYGPAVADVGAGWYYNWSPRPADVGGAAPFVPMIWGADSVNPDDLARARESGDTLLGFNEPDLAGQAEMSVDQALDLWPQLEATGLRLGSPAVAFGGADADGWLDRFMSGARAQGRRVDFIALHWYGGDFSPAAVGQLEGYLRAVHDRYGLPVWLTEYALIRFDGGGATFPTDAEQAAFVTASTAMLEGLDFVERYAWFALPTPDEGGNGTGLYSSPTSPTPAGEAYRAAG